MTQLTRLFLRDTNDMALSETQLRWLFVREPTDMTLSGWHNWHGSFWVTQVTWLFLNHNWDDSLWQTQKTWLFLRNTIDMALSQTQLTWLFLRVTTEMTHSESCNWDDSDRNNWYVSFWNSLFSSPFYHDRTYMTLSQRHNWHDSFWE